MKPHLHDNRNPNTPLTCLLGQASRRYRSCQASSTAPLTGSSLAKMSGHMPRSVDDAPATSKRLRQAFQSSSSGEAVGYNGRRMTEAMSSRTHAVFSV